MEQNLDLGTLRPVIREGKVMEVIGNLTDITDRKRVEVELSAAKEQLESFFHHTTDAIGITDMNSCMQRVNGSFVEMYGWRSDEMIGNLVLNVLADKQEEYQELRSRVLVGEVIRKYKTVRVKKDGSRVIVKLTLFPLKTETVIW